VILTCTAISAGAVSPSEPGYGGRIEGIENMQMTASRGNPVVLKFTKGMIGHLSKRAFQIELDDDHEACQFIKIIFPDFGPCKIENKRHDQYDLVVSPETNITRVLDPTISRPLSKYPVNMGAGDPSDVLLQAGAQADQQSPEHNHFEPRRYFPETPVLPIKQIPSAEWPRDEIPLQAGQKDFISHDNSITKQLDTTKKEQEGKHNNLVDSHDNFITSEPNRTLYNPKIFASMGTVLHTGHPYDVLLQDQESPGHNHSKSLNSRNPILPGIPSLYGDAADVTETAGHPPAAEILRLKATEIMRLTVLTKRDHLLHQKIGRALHAVPNSKERAGHPDEILLQADNGGDGDDDVLPSAIDAPSVTVLPSITDASSMTKMRVVNTAVAGMRRRLTEVSNWEVMKTACGSGSSGTVTLSDDFVNKLVVSESNTKLSFDIAETEETCLDAACNSAMATCLADYACMQLMYSAKACYADPDADVHACYITELSNNNRCEDPVNQYEDMEKNCHSTLSTKPVVAIKVQ
jgi:hypothetical protein